MTCHSFPIFGRSPFPGHNPTTGALDLGCTLYWLLTAQVPYVGDTMVSKVMAHREQKIPSLLAARSDVPEQLDRIFQ
ncbi:MAG: hypothetical protein O3C40_33390 [Planctomycetota bacterium]|nr:hypothetical protein [Planctomycetota bacterium]